MRTFVVSKYEHYDDNRIAVVVFQAENEEHLQQQVAAYFEDWNLNEEYTDTHIQELPVTFEGPIYILTDD